MAAAAERMDDTGIEDPVGIICGGGSLPFAVADAIKGRGRGVLMFPIRGAADPKRIKHYPHHWMAIGQLGRLYRLARAAHCTEIVFIGTVVRPAIRNIRFDWETVRLLPRIYRIYRGGDDFLLKGVSRIFEERGFRLRASQELAPEILVREGPLGSLRPSPQDLADIARGRALLDATSPYDIGQGVVIGRQHVVAIEAAEGTDLMLERVAALRRAGRVGLPGGAGVLVKAPKAGQDRRFDLPTIGPGTVEKARLAGLAGIAVIAGETLIAEPQETARAADRAGIFVVGIGDGPQ